MFTLKKANKTKPKHLLVIRLSAMGDVALMAPVLNALVKQYPQVSVTLLTLEKWTPIFAHIPGLKLHFAHPKTTHRGLGGLWKLSREIAALRPSAIADLHHVLRSKIIRFFLKPLQLQTAVLDKGRAEKKALTAFPNKTFRPLTHTTLRYAAVFESLGYPLLLAEEALLPKPATPQLTLPQLTTPQPDPKTKCIGVAPFAAHIGKQYPLQKMKEALRIFMAEQKNKYQLVFFGGGPVEQPLIKQLCQDFPKSTHALDLSFEQELSLIAHLDLMLAMDSGNAHLAAMYGVPTLTLWGNTHPYAGFYPFLQDPNNALLADRNLYPGLPTSVFGNKVPKGYEKVMDTIAPVAVAEKMAAILEKPSASGQK